VAAWRRQPPRAPCWSRSGPSSLYYRAPIERQAEPSARLLASAVAGGDVVVFTGVRALPVLYYLDRAGYRWSDGYCRSAATGARFYCRMFPRRTEETPAAADASRGVPSLEEARAEVDDYAARLGARGAVWVAFESGQVEGRRLRVPESDAPLVRELERRGFKRDTSGAGSGWLIVPFRKS
jgi:hypothetical protein